MRSVKNWIVIFVHAIVWLAYMFLLLEAFSNRDTFDVALEKVLVLVIPQIVLVYLNVFVLIPVFFNRKKYWEYGGLVLISFIILYFYYAYIPDLLHAHYNVRGEIGPKRPPPFGWREGFPNPIRLRAIFNLSSAISIFLISTIIEIARSTIVKDKETARLKSENLHTELKFLKSQINPHFLFNALNNIYAMSVMQSKEAPQMILKLSDILRYNLYDGTQEKLPLEKEIKYIENFISLQKLKDDKIQNIKVDFSGADGGLMIAPLILIPFVENSFKHSKIEDISKGWINMELKTSGNKIEFKVNNSIPDKNHKKDREGGIGLENVKRRLELIYPGRHVLVIDERNDLFSVKLNILT